MHDGAWMDLLTTAEAADYLRLRERKIYELVAAGEIPCTKVTGKWLFPRHELDLWVLSELHRPDGMAPPLPPPIIGGSQDDLLEWTLRSSQSGLASLNEGTENGLTRLARGDLIAAGIHFHAEDELSAPPNIAAIRDLPELHDSVLVAFARREQGLAITPGNPKKIKDFADILDGKVKVALRQKGAGAQQLLELLLAKEGVRLSDLNRADTPSMSGPDLVATVRSGLTDCGIAPRSAAAAHGLDFLPLAWENYDLVMRQRSYFQPSMQIFLRYITTPVLTRRAVELGGYDVARAGEILFVK